MRSKGMVLVLLSAALAGCQETGSCRLSIRFPDAVTRAKTAAVDIWVLDPGRAVCADLLAGRSRPDDLSPHQHVRIIAPAAGAALDRVPVGSALFFVSAEDSAGRKLLGGCREVSVSATGAVDVEIALEAMCWPTDEVCKNGFDDDCDGDTDENCSNCTTDAGCDDQNDCSIDLCIEGTCHYQAFPDNTPCSDASECTHGDRCSGGFCVGEARDCSAFDSVCLEGDCDPQTGECLASPRPVATACDDGRFCTDQDSCVAGVCTGQPKACDDGDACTRDSCSEGDRRCTHVLEPLAADLEGPPGDTTCENGSDDDCDRLTDAADPGCLSCAVDWDCDDLNPCTRPVCVLQVCANEPLADGTPCEDGLFCSVGETCTSGVCQGGRPRDCDPGVGPCEEGVCLEDRKTCETRARGDGVACDDGDFCTVSDACEGGICLGRARPCDDSDECSTDVCVASEMRCLHSLAGKPGAETLDLGSSCSNRQDDDCDGLTDMLDPDCVTCTEDAACDDLNPCTDDACAEGRCKNVPAKDERSCDDGRACTEGDHCQAGLCVGAPRDCTTLDDLCHEGFCDESSLACKSRPRPDGTLCDDGHFCTGGDRCEAGECRGIDRSCDDSDGCTLDACDEEAEVCTHQRVAKSLPEGLSGSTRCANGLDDDCDGLIDLDDPDCR